MLYGRQWGRRAAIWCSEVQQDLVRFTSAVRYKVHTTAMQRSRLGENEELEGNF